MKVFFNLFHRKEGYILHQNKLVIFMLSIMGKCSFQVWLPTSAGTINVAQTKLKYSSLNYQII